MHIVLIEPEIPQNTGNIARTCAAVGARLHLVGKLGFSLEDRYLKRAGLDYWPLVEVCHHPDYAAYLREFPHADRYFLSTKGQQTYSDVRFPPDVHLVFGRETAGLPPEILEQAGDHLIRIPMVDAARSLNLSNSVAIVVYEAMRQHSFPVRPSRS